MNCVIFIYHAYTIFVMYRQLSFCVYVLIPNIVFCTVKPVFKGHSQYSRESVPMWRVSLHRRFLNLKKTGHRSEEMSPDHRVSFYRSVPVDRFYCTCLVYSIMQVGIKTIEDSVNVDTIPQLVTIKKGLLVITRQWKNILYMPRLAENSFKSKRSKIYNVNFQLPTEKSLDRLSTTAAMEDWDTSAENFMVVDEKTSLLKAEGGSIHTPSVYSMALSGPPLQAAQPQARGHKMYVLYGGAFLAYCPLFNFV